MELCENKTTPSQNLWDTVKTVLWGKCIELNAYARKEERSKINHLNLYLKKLEMEQQIKSKISRAEINELEK